jgi:1-acyl-sn-glycerol-3-phosphate acyltransferase
MGTTANQKLRLKKPNGWFPAGEGFAKAVPVLPVTILGGHEAWPPGRVLPRPGRLTIIYHQVITPPADGSDLRHAARQLAHQVREAVASRLPAAVEPPAAGDGPA